MRANDPQKVQRAMSAVTLQTFIDLYLADMRLKNRAPDSIDSVSGHLRRFAAQIGGGEQRLNRVTTEVARGYIAALQAAVPAMRITPIGRRRKGRSRRTLSARRSKSCAALAIG